MKTLLTLTNVLSAVALLEGLAACATNNTAAIDTSQKEMLLSQAGFISESVITPRQQQQVKKLTIGIVSPVKCKGKLFYVYPTTKRDRILVGQQAQYDAYEKLQRQNGAYLTGETAEPNHSNVQEFDGFGPLPDNPAWQ